MYKFQIGDNVFANVRLADWNIAYVEIEGTGDMYEDITDFIQIDHEFAWTNVQGRCTGDLIIPDGVTSIANNFMNAEDFIGSLTYVKIGKDVNRIGDYAFGSIQLTDLTKIDIDPEAKIQTLGDYSFASLINLESIDFNGTVTEIGEGCFYNCRKLKTLNLSKRLGTIKRYTFFGCSLLESFNYKNCINDLSADAFTEGSFYGCNNLSEITIKFKVAFPTSGGNNFMKVELNEGVSCDANGCMYTTIWSNNQQAYERDWLGLDNRNVTIKRIPSTLSIKHEGKIYDIMKLS